MNFLILVRIVVGLNHAKELFHLPVGVVALVPGQVAALRVMTDLMEFLNINYCLILKIVLVQRRFRPVDYILLHVMVRAFLINRWIE